MTKQWTMRWKNWIAPTKLPGVWEIKEGGHLVRRRVLDPTTGKQKEIKRVMPDADAGTAYKWLQEETQRIRDGIAPAAAAPKTRFCDYAVSLLERKVAAREIKSARGRERWVYTLRHLISGTKEVAGFGELFVDHISVSRVETWRAKLGALITSGDYSPSTANGWIAIFCVIMKAAKREFSLAVDPTEGLKPFDTSEHETYTEEEPNALTNEELPVFLDYMRDLYPQHYAMTFLGFATGLRPSSLRPLRRSGPTPDVLWNDGVILIRRSHTLGSEVMNTTKTKRRQRINVPSDLIAVLRWHVATQLTTPEQKASDLLFPTEEGGYRSEALLMKPFAEVADAMELKKHITPRAMRRTFNDVARVAKIETFVTKSISGHQTDRMKELYSTVNPVEQREGIGRVLRVMELPPSGESGAPSGAPIPSSGAPVSPQNL